MIDFFFLGLSCLLVGILVGAKLENREWLKYRLQDEVDKRIAHILRTEYTVELVDPYLTECMDEIHPKLH